MRPRSVLKWSAGWVALGWGGLWLCMGMGNGAFAQPSPLPYENAGYEHTLIERANTAGHEVYMTEPEKAVVLMVNLARLDGVYFVQTYLEPYADLTQPALARLRDHLLDAPPLPPLRPAYALYKSASMQALDLGQSGKIPPPTPASHLTARDRIARQLPGAGGYASSYYLGTADPMDIVLSLLSGLADTGQRSQQMMLSPNLDYVGVAIRPHALQCSHTVIDFARRPQIVTGPTEGESARKRRRRNDIYFMDCPPGAKVARPMPRRGSIIRNLF